MFYINHFTSDVPGLYIMSVTAQYKVNAKKNRIKYNKLLRRRPFSFSGPFYYVKYLFFFKKIDKNLKNSINALNYYEIKLFYITRKLRFHRKWWAIEKLWLFYFWGGLGDLKTPQNRKIRVFWGAPYPPKNLKVAIFQGLIIFYGI